MIANNSHSFSLHPILYRCSPGIPQEGVMVSFIKSSITFNKFNEDGKQNYL